MEGYVRLKSAFGFSNIWLVLDGQDLAYYESLDLKTQTPKKLKGVLNVRDGILKKFQQQNMQMGIKIKNAKGSQKLSFDCPSATAWNSWFNALNRAIKEHIEEFKKVQLPYEFRKVLEIDPDIQKLSKGIITRAYKKISLREHPDKGGNADTFSKITEAYSYLINYQAEMDARENSDIIQYEAIVEKANGVGLGVHLVEDKLREQFVVTQVEESIVIHGLSAEAQGEIQINDALVGIDQDEISHWYFSRLKARLDTSRVPFGSKVLLVFERRVPREPTDSEVTSNFSSPAVSPMRTRPTNDRSSVFSFPSPPPSPMPPSSSSNNNASSTKTSEMNSFDQKSCDNKTDDSASPIIVSSSSKDDNTRTNASQQEEASSLPAIVLLPPNTITTVDAPSIADSETNVEKQSLDMKQKSDLTMDLQLKADKTIPTFAENCEQDIAVGNVDNNNKSFLDEEGSSSDEGEEDDDDVSESSGNDDDEGNQGVTIAHEDIVEVLRELEVARSLNSSLQIQKDNFTKHCESLSQTLRNQESTIQSQDDTIRQLRDENERLKHENSTMRGLLLHDQFPQTAEKMKEYLLLLQKEVIALRTQLKEFDPVVLANNISSLRLDEDGEINKNSNEFLHAQHQQRLFINKRSSRSPQHAAISRGHSNSPSKTQKLFVGSPSHLSDEMKQSERLSSGVQQVYRQREERAKTVEIKLRDLLKQA